ncbi:hypothetical protein Bca4012_017930 [Brassica carinata]
MGVSLSSETKHLTPSPRLDRNPLSCGLGQIKKRGKKQASSGLQGIRVEKSNMLLHEAEDELVGGKRRKTKVISATVILSGARHGGAKKRHREFSNRAYILWKAAVGMMVKTRFMMPLART